MRRFLAVSVALLLGVAIALPARADGMPELKTKTKVHIVKKVRQVRRTVRRRVTVPQIVALPGPYDLHAYPPQPLDSAYEPAMVEYFRDPSITGYRPGSAAGYVHDSAGMYVAGVSYHRTTWLGARAPQLPPPPQTDNFPFRKYAGALVCEYDGVTGEYVALSRADAAAAIGVAQDKPLPLWSAPPR